MIPELASFALAWFLVTITLGPNAVITIDSSIQSGWPRAALVPVGISAAAVVYLTLTFTILVPLLESAPMVLSIAIVLGSLYLLYLAYTTLTRRAPVEKSRTPKISKRRLFFLGFTTSLSNPKAALMYVSILPGVIHGGAVPPVLIAATAWITVFCVYSSYSLFAGALRDFVIGYPVRQKTIDVLAALTFAFIAISNLYSVAGGNWR